MQARTNANECNRQCGIVGSRQFVGGGTSCAWLKPHSEKLISENSRAKSIRKTGRPSALVVLTHPKL